MDIPGGGGGGGFVPFIIPAIPGILNENTEEQGQDVDMTDPSTWPTPPTDSPCEVGEPSRTKPRSRGEKSIYDEEGGEWRPHPPDKYHPELHWDYKPPGANSPWRDVPIKK
jgi:hypothetical protein